MRGLLSYAGSGELHQNEVLRPSRETNPLEGNNFSVSFSQKERFKVPSDPPPAPT